MREVDQRSVMTMKERWKVIALGGIIGTITCNGDSVDACFR